MGTQKKTIPERIICVCHIAEIHCILFGVVLFQNWAHILPSQKLHLINQLKLIGLTNYN